jgi:hypothetical protein
MFSDTCAEDLHFTEFDDVPAVLLTSPVKAARKEKESLEKSLVNDLLFHSVGTHAFPQL